MTAETVQERKDGFHFSTKSSMTQVMDFANPHYHQR
jgi:hypothetical protein